MGLEILPDQPELEKLSKYPNVRTLGYVRTGYGQRNISQVLQEVAIYANWSILSPAWSVSGIFFDETISEYSSEGAAYLDNIDDFVKNKSGIAGTRLVGLSTRQRRSADQEAGCSQSWRDPRRTTEWCQPRYRCCV